MVKVKDDLTGKTFGRLTVMYQTEDYIESNGDHRAKYHCKCSCGNEYDVLAKNLKRGVTKSCGCLHRELGISKLVNSNAKKNTYEFRDNYGICWNQEKTWKCYFDLEDYDKIKNYYGGNHNGYAVSHEPITHKGIEMHNLVMNFTPDYLHTEVDHKNNQRNDNRKSNLRITTRKNNQRNRSMTNRNTSGVIGVYFHKLAQKWCARIRVDGKEIYLGLYDNLEDATKVRKEAEQKYFGEYAYDEGRERISED